MIARTLPSNLVNSIEYFDMAGSVKVCQRRSACVHSRRFVELRINQRTVLKIMDGKTERERERDQTVAELRDNRGKEEIGYSFCADCTIYCFAHYFGAGSSSHATNTIE